MAPKIFPYYDKINKRFAKVQWPTLAFGKGKYEPKLQRARGRAHKLALGKASSN